MSSKGIDARAAKEWADLNALLLKSLPVGISDHDAVCFALHQGGLLTLKTAGRKLSFRSQTVYAQVAALFKGRHTWAFGDCLFKLDQTDGKINALEIRAT